MRGRWLLWTFLGQTSWSCSSFFEFGLLQRRLINSYHRRLNSLRLARELLVLLKLNHHPRHLHLFGKEFGVEETLLENVFRRVHDGVDDCDEEVSVEVRICDANFGEDEVPHF